METGFRYAFVNAGAYLEIVPLIVSARVHLEIVSLIVSARVHLEILRSIVSYPVGRVCIGYQVLCFFCSDTCVLVFLCRAL